MLKKLKELVCKKEYVHYGSSKFDKSRFMPIHNESGVFTKPSGGLWASPLNCGYGWIDWVLDNDFRLNVYNRCRFTFTLKPDTRILRITEATQLKDLPRIENDILTMWVSLDYEKLSKEYDAVEVLISKDNQLYWDLYGWDVDSILIMNPDVVVFKESRDLRGNK